MKNLSKMIIPLLFLAFSLVSVNESFAQCSANVVAEGFVSPGSAADLEYNVKGCVLGTFVDLCLYTDANNLCLGHGATAEIFVDGVSLGLSTDISQVGSEISFRAFCGSNVYVLVTSYQGPKGCDAIELVSFSLRQI